MTNTISMQVKTPYLQVRSNCLIYYELSELRARPKPQRISNPSYSGKVTGNVQKRIRKAIDILTQTTPTRTTYNSVTKKHFPFKLNFVTLTISKPERVEAKEAYPLLIKPFLRKLRKSGKFSYVWKAEYQQDTDYYGKVKLHGGQLHYHLATNAFLPWQSIRQEWNNLQRKARYLDGYALKNNHFDANSTDVHAINHIRDVGAYLSKYLSKDGKSSIIGKTWDCSKDLKRTRFSFTPSEAQIDKIDYWYNNKQCKIIKLDHCIIIKTPQPLQILDSTNLQNYQSWIT